MRKSRHSALVVGLGRFGSAAAERLVALGWDVVGVDVNTKVIESVQDRLAHVVQLDASDEAALSSLGVSDFEVCIVSRGDSIESSLLLVLNLQHLEAKRIVAKAASQYHARILVRLGVSQIIFPEADAGNRLAESLQSPHLAQWMQISEDRELAIIRVPKGRAGCPLNLWREIHGKSLQILGHLTPEGRPLKLDMHMPLQRDEILIVVGEVKDILALAG